MSYFGENYSLTEQYSVIMSPEMIVAINWGEYTY